MNAGLITIFVVCLGVSFLMSGMEAGVFALSRLRVRQQKRAGNANAAALHRHLEQPENFLWTILAGNTVANFIIVTLGVYALQKWFEPWPVAGIGVFVVGLVVFYAAFELWPKALFRMYPNRLCMGLARPFGLIHWTLRPLVWAMTWLANQLLRWTGGRSFTGHLFGNRDELRQVMQDSAQGLSGEERTMINRVLDLQHLTVQHIAVPLAKAVTVATDTPLADALALCREHGFTRLPVWRTEGKRRRIAGLLTLRSLLYDGPIEAGQTAGQFLRPALFLDHDTRLEVALRRLQRTGPRAAIVLGPDRQEIGLVTLEDILKVIFGEVRF